MKRTPLKRRAPLRRGRRQVRDVEATREFRRQVIHDAGYRCVACGADELALVADGLRLEAHHVLPRRVLVMEGHLDVLYDPANGLSLCTLCHARHESRFKALPRSLVPLRAWQFAQDHGLVNVLRRIYV